MPSPGYSEMKDSPSRTVTISLGRMVTLGMASWPCARGVCVCVCGCVCVWWLGVVGSCSALVVVVAATLHLCASPGRSACSAAQACRTPGLRYAPRRARAAALPAAPPAPSPGCCRPAPAPRARPPPLSGSCPRLQGEAEAAERFAEPRQRHPQALWRASSLLRTSCRSRFSKALDRAEQCSACTWPDGAPSSATHRRPRAPIAATLRSSATGGPRPGWWRRAR